MDKYKRIELYLCDFLKKEVQDTGLNSVVLGLSGGIDSAVVAVLLQKVFPDNFTAIMMPSGSSNPQNLEDAKELCERFGMAFVVEPVKKLMDIYFKDRDKDTNKVRIGNFGARMRMAILYDYSAQKNALVIGTSNKSEIALGYGTIFGDLACAINPIGDMYKTEIFAFAKYLGVSENIINKPPSADLWTGQSDEKELGFSYKEIDEVLIEFLDKKLDKEAILRQGFDKDLVSMIFHRFYANQFKGKLPTVASLQHIF